MKAEGEVATGNTSGESIIRQVSSDFWPISGTKPKVRGSSISAEEVLLNLAMEE